MRTLISCLLALTVGYTTLIPFAIASQSSAELLSQILKSQEVSDSKALDCTLIESITAEQYGEAYFTEMVDTASPEYGTFMKNFPAENRSEIYRNMGLQNLGCVKSVGAPEVVGEVSAVAGKAVATAPQSASIQSTPMKLSEMGFIATWTTLVWMFSALGFAVFMVWITSSKFRFQFRKMAEGEFDMNDKAMTILKERFARGEVTKEQFDKMRRDILN